jgi:diguanylate cyclase (GGDEF)-like protein
MTNSAATILIVDDEIQNRKLLEALLRAEGYGTLTAANGEEALACAVQQAPDLILLDVMMPGIDGNQTSISLKANPFTANIPIIMVTALDDLTSRLTGLKAGAEDFLSKPVDRAELTVRVRNLLRLKAYSDLLKNHSVTLEMEVQARIADLEHMANYDSVTGLPNRALFYETLRKTLDRASGDGCMVAVLIIDLDHFKNINDTLGHAIGDELLRQFSNRLVHCVHTRDTVGRLGGDEFALILTMQDNNHAATAVANKIREVLREPFDLKGHEVTVTASIGITVHPDDASDPETLLKYADTAMYRAKKAGRDTFRFFTAQMNAEALAQIKMEKAVRKAVENNEFVLFYQPKVQLSSGRIIGLEALLRWQRPGHGLVSPAEFIPVLEETGLIVGVGTWVIDTACEQIGRWMRSATGPMQVAVNVSGRQFVEGDLEGDVVKALARHDIPSDLLELELTESSLMVNTTRTIATLQNLKNLGVQISLDDFGTGYSSLAYLRRFPIDKLKIDIAFIRDITTNPDAASIALTIIRMAHGLKLDVIAEGVETEAQLAYLRRYGCDQIQGYYFSRPLPLAEIEQILRDEKRLPPTDGIANAPLKTLLLVDDEPDILVALQRVLRLEGYNILSACSAAEGFDMMALHPVQVILCDQRMPVMSGAEFLDRVKVMYPDALRIILTGYTDLESIMDSINRGSIYRFYTKPWDSEVLRDSVREAFRHYALMHGGRPEQLDDENRDRYPSIAPVAQGRRRRARLAKQ